ncbi:MAG TPA: aminotransferase class I/II-fold pyridoxal phosphate-dependent enzyme [Chitinophagales bacterium]|nr:aminotransferase class I/II-fold pyridoxal phosphate-dependent enzyme [Chitinophagales bacterium]
MKNNITELALLGGTPLFADTLHVGRPNIGNRDRLLARINDMLDRRWLSNGGPFAQELEMKLADFLGVKHCIVMCNATIALEIAMRALGLTGEVILPSFTFVASAHALQWQEITPVFCDVNPDTHNIDPSKIENLITPRTTGILGVHVWGRACDIDALSAIAKKHNLKLMFDAAHAFGCTYRGQMIGGFGNVEVFSFHATKFFNSFEGGVVTTNNDELAKKIRSMHNFGFAGLDLVTEIGTNGKMSEAAAAMGLTSLESLDDFIKVNQDNYRIYSQELSDLPGIKLIRYNEDERNNYQYIVVEINEELTGISRDLLVRVLHSENILARRYFYPGCHKMEPYRSYFPNAGLVLQETEKLNLSVLQLPTGTAVGQEEISKICQLIRFVTTNGHEIRTSVVD